ncbi:unnamed protein product [Calypogeia fissa]
MLCIRSSVLPGICEVKAFSSFFWTAIKDGNSYAVLFRPKRVDWSWLTQWHQHSPASANVATGATTGNTGEAGESASNFPLEWDPFEDLFGLGVDLRSRKDMSKPKQKYEEEMACPTCEGRGYLLCPHCNFRKSEGSCPYCSGKGYHDCPLCHGECVVWEDYINESTSRASHHSRSPLQIAEDDVIENMAITPVPKRKTRRVYGPPRPETVEKIRRSLKDLEARTGSISKRMKILHLDPVLRTQRTAAIKKARGTDEARKLTSQRIKEYFKSPENRLKHSQRMTGVRFTCTACGEKGHRRHFCPKLGFERKKPKPIRSYHCSFCGQLGHTVRTCPKLKGPKRLCSICGQAGHNSRTCYVVTAKN